jgi:hypothetical protein
VIELRQYTLKPGQRDVLIDLFDRHFVESQESAGMTVIGQFGDRQRPDRFVWMRGFPDMPGRHRALDRFYNGPVWAAHRRSANDTMLDSDDVLLLRPARPDTAFVLEERRAGDSAAGVLTAIYQLSKPADESVVSKFEAQVRARLRSRGVDVRGVFVTETAPNTFTRLPVREGEHVLVWVGTFERARTSPAWLDTIAGASQLEGTVGRPTLLDLEPTSRSLLGDGIHAARASKHDFDFLHGSWNVHNRYLKGRLQKSTDWIEFDAQSDVHPLLDGLGQLDQYRALRDSNAIEGVTLRLFNPATGEWSLYWTDTVNPGVLLPPMVGRFNGDVGEFLGDEFVEGKRVLCRIYWTRTNPASPRWEQAFSDDDGRTWETNWVMTFTRR